MIRVACLGNSHAAAFKMGWDEMKISYPGVSIDFFAGAANTMKNLEVRDGRIFPTVPAVREMFVAYGRQESIGAGYDLYLLAGLGFGLVPLMSLYAKHRPPRFYSRDSGNHLISEEMLREARIHVFDKCAAIGTLGLVRSITSDAPVYMLPNPLPSADILSNPALAFWSNEELLSDCSAYLNEAVSRIQDAIYFPQPPATLEGTYLTKPAYAKEARLLKARWTRPTNDGDPYHMNAAYGFDVLSELFTSAGILPSKQADAQTA
ncbi:MULTISPECIES: hypothetical protein [Sinorhizobium]|uniref:hypothetical protein n=1 Tax=Sinorhizobium TaxID=28105 RepID=UPI0002861C8A|nr:MULTISPECIES: hypothetical protein [Sinorhizobium]ARS68768.1 hypothetical protein SMRU11_16850 [Sinorhizobium meliloti RU11/001]ASP69172.1 hypothetical protein CDO29_33070 [Sinorhizobium meliloti]ASP81576.1 hypothetical protein CDO27_27355 [Sinorhizobium meliloti]MDE3760400.1 hypothetical protein [Sinorhizobium meliloti]MQV10360.1 hypothetical protein [Sinorhizobium meliloti]